MKLYLYTALAALLLALPSVNAQPIDSMHVQQSIDIILKHTASIRTDITAFAMKTFYYLCGISFVLTGIKLIFKDSDLRAFFHILVKYMLIIGFFKYIIENGPEIGAAIIDSLSAIGASRTSHASPYTMLEMCLNAYSSLSNIDFDIYNIADVFVIKTTAIAFLILNFLIVVRYIVSYVSAYMLCVLGIACLGTAALSATRDIAINYIKSIFASGLELFTIAFLCTVHKDIIKDTISLLKEDGALDNIRSHMFLIFLSLLMYALSKTLPSMLSSLVFMTGQSQSMPGAASARFGINFSSNFITRALTLVRK